MVVGGPAFAVVHLAFRRVPVPILGAYRRRKSLSPVPSDRLWQGASFGSEGAADCCLETSSGLPRRNFQHFCTEILTSRPPPASIPWPLQIVLSPPSIPPDRRRIPKVVGFDIPFLGNVPSAPYLPRKQESTVGG